MLVVSNFHDECTRLALELGRELLLAAIKMSPSTSEAIKPLRRKVDRKYLGPSTAAIVNAAEARKIPPSACSTTATSSSSATAPPCAASGRPKPTAPAPSPKPSRATRT
jgi:hypothetical protein